MHTRVRFAPSPTGFMHIGNVRAALLNYLFARQHGGTFILRIEDTDLGRNLDEARTRIIEDLNVLNLKFDEGPGVGGNYGPYLQSQRNDIYQEYLNQLIINCQVYRCFCSPEELEIRRDKQRAMGKPPRYDRTCAHYSDDKIKAKLAVNTPFVWRFKLNYDQVVTVNDMAKGSVDFELKNFSDFALTRQNGSFTFLFANFVDDVLMKITHVIRGEDHLSNTAQQAALYDAFATQLPKFWHLPIICNQKGEKLSKRDFGFSLEDLIKDGYLPESVTNFMGTLGVSFKQEIQNLDELVKNYPFNHLHSAATIRYDAEKLLWFNHKWIEKLDITDLKNRLLPLLHNYFPKSISLSDQQLTTLVTTLKPELKTLNDIKEKAAFFFSAPTINITDLEKQFSTDKVRIARDVIQTHLNSIDSIDTFVNAIKKDALEQGLSVKEIFGTIRFFLEGKTQGLGIHQLIELLGTTETKERLKLGLD